LLPGVTAQADSSATSHTPSLLKDGWYGDCSAWAPEAGEGGPVNAELDLGGIFRLSGVAVTADLAEARDGGTWQVDVMVGLTRQALSRIDSFEGAVFNGKRLFSFEPTAARVVRVQLGTRSKAQPLPKGGPVRIDEIEVYGECIK
jgi:hypothetical protein